MTIALDACSVSPGQDIIKSNLLDPLVIRDCKPEIFKAKAQSLLDA